MFSRQGGRASTAVGNGGVGGWDGVVVVLVEVVMQGLEREPPLPQAAGPSPQLCSQSGSARPSPATPVLIGVAHHTGPGGSLAISTFGTRGWFGLHGQ